MAYSARGRTKSFPVFDCDSHIYEPPEVWDKYIPKNNRDFAKAHFYRDADRLFLVRNGRISFRDPDKWKYPGETWHPGLTKKIIGATQPGTQEWDEKIGRNKSARDPLARLKDMDAAGIDQVMVFPSTFVYLPLVESADAAYICARAYNDWVYDYSSADRKRLYPAAVLPVQNTDYAIEELRRVAKRGFRCALVRPIIAHGKYPTFPEFDPLWKEFEELGIVLGMHTFPSRGEALSPELNARMGANRKRLFGDEDLLVYSPGQFVANIMQIMGSKAGGRCGLWIYRRSNDLDRCRAHDRLVGKVSALESGDPGIQLELAAAGNREGRDLSRSVQAHRRGHRRSPRGILQTLLHCFRKRRNRDPALVGFV
jgi:hypothetical protein